MPEYAYQCERCQKEFTVKLAVGAHDDQSHQHKIRCPKCQSTEVKHLIEAFYVTTSKKS
jgi:putative FmdB family regulatory protein